MTTKMLELLESAHSQALAETGGTLQDAIGELTQSLKGKDSWIIATDCDGGLRRVVACAMRTISREQLFMLAFHTCGKLIAIGAIPKSYMTTKKWDRFCRDVMGQPKHKSDVLVFGNEPEWMAKVLAHIQAGRIKEIKFGEMN